MVSDITYSLLIITLDILGSIFLNLKLKLSLSLCNFMPLLRINFLPILNVLDQMVGENLPQMILSPICPNMVYPIICLVLTLHSKMEWLRGSTDMLLRLLLPCYLRLPCHPLTGLLQPKLLLVSSTFFLHLYFIGSPLGLNFFLPFLT